MLRSIACFCRSKKLFVHWCAHFVALYKLYPFPSYDKLRENISQKISSSSTQLPGIISPFFSTLLYCTSVCICAKKKLNKDYLKLLSPPPTTLRSVVLWNCLVNACACFSMIIYSDFCSLPDDHDAWRLQSHHTNI